MSRLRRVTEVEGRLVPHRWDWAEANAGRIAAHWQVRKAARPAIFNGRVLMLAGPLDEGDRIAARFFETDYASLTAWLDFGRPGAREANGFAMGALRGADGGFILGRMGTHTANAGQLYFPAGTPDLGDVTEAGGVDLAGSIGREIAEETGLGPADWTIEPGWTLVEDAGQTAFMRTVRLALPAAEACGRIRRFLASEAQPELADVEVVAGPADLDRAAIPPFLLGFFDAIFAGQISKP